MAQRGIKYESPAHKIFEAASQYTDKDVIAIAYESGNKGTLHRFYTLGSLVRYAIDNCDCPLEAVERAKERGEDLHWANRRSSMLTSHARPQQFSFMQKHGDKIKFHGKTFEIVPTPNNNISLKLV
tara:strand:- start:1763 stop:2140 length:378 start_codon:yes stop_codon:yes gene_type:complete